MIIYLFKVIACSALFYAFYFLLLRNEKMLLFNRVYLLSTLIAAFLMPRATITVKQPVLPVAVTELRVVEEPGWQEALFYWSLVLFMVVSFLLMIRLVLVADGFGVHVPKGYVYTAMGFSALVEGLNIWARKRKARAATGASGH